MDKNRQQTEDIIFYIKHINHILFPSFKQATRTTCPQSSRSRVGTIRD